MLTLELRKDDRGEPGDLLQAYSQPTRGDALMHIYNTVKHGGFDPYFWIPRNPRLREKVSFDFGGVKVEYDEYGSPRIIVMISADEFMKGQAFGL
jgi:hypothetical protein